MADQYGCTDLDISIHEQFKNLVLTGQVIPIRDLGHGAYGKVIEVKYLEKNYAAKKILPILMENSTSEEKLKLQNLFLHECKIHSILRHPNIVGFVGAYMEQGSSHLVLVMELMDTSLTNYVARSRISVETEISILHDICSGLSYLHNHNHPIMHCDLNPNNILLTHESIAKISNLGMAKVIKAEDKKTKRKLNKARRTMDFMPPESLYDDPVYDTSLDVFSFGGIMLFVINQEWPSPTSMTEYDPKTRTVRGITEVQRRQKYLDKITGRLHALKLTVICCLDNNPKRRPVITAVMELIAQQLNQSGNQWFVFFKIISSYPV